MSLHNLVSRKYAQLTPLDGYDPDTKWYWVLDQDSKRLRFFREEQEMWDYKETLCTKAWNAAIDCIMIELRLMRQD